jgi:hypothetical protein
MGFVALLDRIKAVGGPAIPLPEPPKPVLIPPEFRAKNGTFLPGNPGNGGRQRDYSTRVRERTRDGELLIDTYLEVLAGLTPLPVVDPVTGVVRIPAGCEPTAADRLHAAKLLEARGYGKVPDKVEFTGQVSGTVATFDVSRLTSDQVRAYLEIRRAARGDDLEPAEGQVRPDSSDIMGVTGLAITGKPSLPEHTDVQVVDVQPIEIQGETK